jgi:hypothetical protein
MTQLHAKISYFNMFAPFLLIPKILEKRLVNEGTLTCVSIQFTSYLLSSQDVPFIADMIISLHYK